MPYDGLFFFECSRATMFPAFLRVYHQGRFYDARFGDFQNLVNAFFGLKEYMGGRALGRDHAGRRKMEDKVLIHGSPHQVDAGLEQALWTSTVKGVQTKWYGPERTHHLSRSTKGYAAAILFGLLPDDRQPISSRQAAVPSPLCISHIEKYNQARSKMQMVFLYQGGRLGRSVSRKAGLRSTRAKT